MTIKNVCQVLLRENFAKFLQSTVIIDNFYNFFENIYYKEVNRHTLLKIFGNLQNCYLTKVM